MEPWNARITQRLARISPLAPEKQYHGVYNALLNNVFQTDQGYMIYPIETRLSTEFAVEYEIGFQSGGGEEDTPVMLLEVKRATDLNTISTRISADIQVRTRFEVMKPTLRVPILIIISAIGTRCCVYRFNRATGQVEPPMIQPTDYRITEDLAPADRWNIDIGTQAGRVELDSWLNVVKAICLVL
ncbi:hypothetical protein BGX26_001510 [Mortierella sp. AD094]|nr:hypothetical protein BGX26_001510 [Mortierella sp. AD094]